MTNLPHHDVMQSLSARILELQPENGWYPHYLAQQGHRMELDLHLLVGAVAPPARVLDIGCNPPLVVATLKRLGYRAEGIDLNPEAFARLTGEEGLTIHRCDIEQATLPFPDRSFDAISMSEVFEHLRLNPVNTMREVFRVLKDGGLLQLTTPNLFSLGGIRNFLMRQQAHFWTTRDLFDELDMVNTSGFAGHVREYTYREVEGFLRRVGFCRVEPTFRLGGTKGWTQGVYHLAPFLRPNVAFHAWR